MIFSIIWFVGIFVLSFYIGHYLKIDDGYASYGEPVLLALFSIITCTIIVSLLEYFWNKLKKK